MLQPNDTWKWYFDTETDSLMMDLGDDMLFRVALPAKMLSSEARNNNIFTVEDVESYQIFKEGMSDLVLSDARKSELALNATAARRFHKPIMPKSWFFEPQIGFDPVDGELVTLKTPYGCGLFLIVENSGSASLCMFACVEPLQLTDAKSINFCETIKVMNDRMMPNVVAIPLDLALVG